MIQCYKNDIYKNNTTPEPACLWSRLLKEQFEVKNIETGESYQKQGPLSSLKHCNNSFKKSMHNLNVNKTNASDSYLIQYFSDAILAR